MPTTYEDLDRGVYRRPLEAIPELVLVGHQSVEAAGLLPLPLHRHEVIEVTYIARGAVRWWSAESWHYLTAESAFLTLPGAVQAGNNGTLEPCDLYWMQLASPVEDEPYFGLPPDEAADLMTHLRRLDSVVLGPAPGVGHRLKTLCSVLGKPGAALVAQRVRASVLGCLTEIAELPGMRAAPSPPIEQAVAIMEGVLHRRLPSDEVAAAVGMSKGYFQHAFRQQIGLAPGDFHLRLRVAEATRLLTGGDDSVTSIAFQLGFPSSQHFAAIFRQVVGTTPRRFRQSSRNSLEPADPEVWDG